jgi:hypothetical protein
MISVLPPETARSRGFSYITAELDSKKTGWI